MRSLSAGQRDKVQKALEQHKSFQGAYLMRPPRNASGRRWAEKRNTWGVSFVHEGIKYVYTSDVRYTTGNVFYRGAFWADDERVTVRKFKALVGAV